VGKCSNGRGGVDDMLCSPAGKLLEGGSRPISAHGLQGLSPLAYRAAAAQQPGLTPLSKLGRQASGPVAPEPDCAADEVSKDEVADILLALKSGAEGAASGADGEEGGEGGSSQEGEGARLGWAGAAGCWLATRAALRCMPPLMTSPPRLLLPALPHPAPAPTRPPRPPRPLPPPLFPPAAAGDPSKRSARPRRAPCWLAGTVDPEGADVLRDQALRQQQLGLYQQQYSDQGICGYRGGKRRRDEPGGAEGPEAPWLPSWRLLQGRERMVVTLQLGGATFSGVLSATDLDM
jgi:hypothetical protein